MDCRCFGKIHEGEVADEANADISGERGSVGLACLAFIFGAAVLVGWVAVVCDALGVK